MIIVVLKYDFQINKPSNKLQVRNLKGQLFTWGIIQTTVLHRLGALHILYEKVVFFEKCPSTYNFEPS